MNNRMATNWGSFATLFAVLMTMLLHGLGAFAVITSVEAGQQLDLERQGRIVVGRNFYEAADYAQKARTFHSVEARKVAGEALESRFDEEAADLVKRDGGNKSEVAKKLRTVVAASGSRNLIPREDADFGLSMLGRSGDAGAMLGSLMLLWWLVMMVCQGEGLELDLQRRRHPMWEWLLSHPVSVGAVFLAEMLAPLSANVTYWTAPLLIGVLYGATQSLEAGVMASVVIGIPITIAAACVGKALEIGAILRLPPRSRGAVIGILGWFGFASMILMLFNASIIPRIVEALGPLIGAAERLPWPLLGLVLGLEADGGFSFLRGMIFCWVMSALAIVAAVAFSARSIRKGLSGAFASDTLAPRQGAKVRFGRDPLVRKEYLWFVRDRSAIVQTILIPVTLAGFQMFNLRGLLGHVQDSWNYLSGGAILFGTYLLWVLGPRSLTSEGSALWLALTWPRGLEGVLKAKARLWAVIASGLVMVVLLAGCLFFPQDAWKIALVALAWCVFARSMAEKAVTLVEPVSESGEARKIPAGRRWAAQLGMLTFAIGICTGQRHLAVVGIVYSWITAAAMWENLRARLPYLYDPWSEELPEPPTLMHAMVSISLLIECASVLTMLVYAIGGRNNLALAQGLGYAICAVGVSIGVARFLAGRGVSAAQIWCWREHEGDSSEASWVRQYIVAHRRDAGWLLAGIGGGIGLGLFAHFYLMVLKQVPSIALMIDTAQRHMQSIPGLATTYAVIAIGLAPFAEEFLFRGLVFRALDRQWGEWRAVLGGAAFFAIYHPPLAWVPVALVGAANCLLFKRSGRLAPAVLLHMTYNIAVTVWA